MAAIRVSELDSPRAAAAALSPEELCDRYAALVYRFATMVAGTSLEAEDLAQTALEKALVALPRYDPRRGELAPWLWRIVVNTARDAGRAARRRELLLQRLVALDRPRVTRDDIPAGISDERLLAAIRGLTRLQRSVIALRYGADLELSEVARALGTSRGSAAMACHRALATLRSALQEAER
jgi:RNA polymerase sigma-70 factor (ECF subfamily)